jgi:membrane-bound ClpP family serine protease
MAENGALGRGNIYGACVQSAIDRELETYLNQNLGKIEAHFGADAIAFFGPLIGGVDDMFKQHIEDIRKNADQQGEHLVVILTTPGGGTETVERIVNTLRHHYRKVSFLVPDYAYSAGTILCMSGDSIFMNYYSVLGPIDPQVQKENGKLVPALGYIDKVNEMIDKSKRGELTEAEFLMLKGMDLADLRFYEQARALTIDLLKKWLVEYKFKNWDTHSSTKEQVTTKEKEDRAEEIAKELGNTSAWHTHSRPINLQALKKLRLQIEDYGENAQLKQMIDKYYNVLQDYIMKYRCNILFHTRKNFQRFSA